jgi:urease accessory protein
LDANYRNNRFGFVCATALLHAIGIGLGLTIGYAGQIYSRRIVQIGGGAMAIAGIAILSGVL